MYKSLLLTPARWPLSRLTLLYLALPLVIFFAGWLKPGVALLAGIPLLFCFWSITRAWPDEGDIFRGRELFYLVLFSFGITAFAGIGGFAPQEFDWAKHNAVLLDCVCQPWPVVLADRLVRWPLVYYLAYYMPAAVVGKIAGYTAAQVALWVWSALGVILACSWFVRLTRQPPALAVLGFFLFGGLVFIGNIVVQLIGLPDNYTGWHGLYPYEVWARIWQIGSHYWMLEWVPGQALAGWLSAGVFLGCPKPLRLVALGYLLVCDLFWSPFIAMGLGLLAFFIFVQERQPWPVKPVGAWPALAFPLGVLLIFYTAKIAPEVGARFPRIPIGWFIHYEMAPGPAASMVLMMLYIAFQFGILLAFVRVRFPPGSDERHLANACGLTLLCLLPVFMGFYNDLAMRASIVPWFGLAVLTVRTFAECSFSHRLRQCFHLVLLFGALTPLIEAGDQARKLLTNRFDSDVLPTHLPALVHMPADCFKVFGAQYVGSTHSLYWKYLANESGGGEIGVALVFCVSISLLLLTHRRSGPGNR